MEINSDIKAGRFSVIVLLSVLGGSADASFFFYDGNIFDGFGGVLAHLIAVLCGISFSD